MNQNTAHFKGVLRRCGCNVSQKFILCHKKCFPDHRGSHKLINIYCNTCGRLLTYLVLCRSVLEPFPAIRLPSLSHTGRVAQQRTHPPISSSSSSSHGRSKGQSSRVNEEGRGDGDGGARGLATNGTTRWPVGTAGCDWPAPSASAFRLMMHAAAQ